MLVRHSESNLSGEVNNETDYDVNLTSFGQRIGYGT